ncbi:MAG: hypothetical protein JWM33_1341 [Caulobacteraceae bacterium]|nr:hypothetical protein [Caulobacteraceae bacterium]
MKTPSAAVAKRVNADNLRNLGEDRLASLLLEFGDAYPSIKRRLRMELAAEVGAEHLAAEIDKRLNTIATSRAKVSWRKRGDFIADLEVQRAMIADRLGGLSPDLALPRLFDFLALSSALAHRVKDPKEELPPVFRAAAEELGMVAARSAMAPTDLADLLIQAVQDDEEGWSTWLEPALRPLDPAVGRAVLAQYEPAAALKRASPRRAALLRALADAAGDADAYIRTLPADLLHAPAVGAEIARRLLAADRVEDALAALVASAPKAPRPRFGFGAKLTPEPASELEWEAQYIEAVEQSGDAAAAQTLRWEAFERTLSREPLAAYIKRLPDFEDVEAADKAFAHAAAWPDFMAGLSFLMTWPAIPEAAAMIQARRSELAGSDHRLADWIHRLEARQPVAALILLRAAIQGALRRGASKADPELVSQLAHAESLSDRVPASAGLVSHEAFAGKL